MKIGIDLCEGNGNQYLVTVDYFSNFIKVDFLKKMTANEVINKLLAHFARYGTPTEIVSDQGTQFTSSEFQTIKKWGIRHAMSSPGHHQSNGKAEAAVKTFKHMIYKCLEAGSNQYEALLELRNTLRQDTGLSPTQMMFGRLTRSRIPAATNKAVSRRCSEKAKQQRRRRRKSVRRTYNKRARDLKPLGAGQTVFYQHVPGQQWRKGKVVSRNDERSYTIEGDAGGVYRRNRVHIRPTCIQSSPIQDIPNIVTSDQPRSVITPNQPRTPPVPSDAAMDDGCLMPGSVPPDDIGGNDVPSSPRRFQRTRKKPGWLNDYVTGSLSVK